MVSTEKMANRGRGRKFNPRRSSTSTLPSIGSIIPEELYDKFNFDDHDDDDDDYDYDDDDTDDEDDIYLYDEESYNSDDDIESGNKLSSILEVASRDISRTTATGERDISRGAQSFESGSSDVIGKLKDASGTGSKSRSRSRSRSSRGAYCDCLDIRCFQDVEGDDGENRRKFKPTCGAYVIMFLVVFMISVWTGIGVVWHLLLRSD